MIILIVRLSFHNASIVISFEFLFSRDCTLYETRQYKIHVLIDVIYVHILVSLSRLKYINNYNYVCNETIKLRILNDSIV